MPVALGENPGGFPPSIHIQVGNVQLPDRAQLVGTQTVLEGHMEFFQQVHGVGKAVSVRNHTGILAAAEELPVGSGKGTPVKAQVQTFQLHVLRGGEAEQNPGNISVGLHGFHGQGVAVLGGTGGNGCLSLHVRLGGDSGLDGKINGIGYQFQLPVGHGLSLHGDYPAVFAVIFRIHVQLEGHQGFPTVAENVAPLLVGGAKEQHLTSGGGGVVPLRPGSVIHQGHEVPAEAVLPVPGKLTQSVGYFIALIFRKVNFQIQPEIPVFKAVTPGNIHADIRNLPDKSLHSQAVTQLPDGGEIQNLAFGLQAVPLRKLLSLGVHHIQVVVPVALGQGAGLAHFLAPGGILGFKGVEIRAGLVGLGAFQPGQGQGGGADGVGILHIDPVYLGIVPGLAAGADFHAGHAQHIHDGTAHQQKHQGNERGDEQRIPGLFALGSRPGGGGEGSDLGLLD